MPAGPAFLVNRGKVARLALTFFVDPGNLAMFPHFPRLERVRAAFLAIAERPAFVRPALAIRAAPSLPYLPTNFLYTFWRDL